MTAYIAPIVEGQTEVSCVERLLHRIWNELLTRPERLQVLPPARGSRPALVHPSGGPLSVKIGDACTSLVRRLRHDPSGRGLLLLLLDAEADCPATLAPRLLASASGVVPSGIPVACVLAKRMLENWIVAGASTLAGVNGLPSPLPNRDRFEEHSGGAWLEKHLRSNSVSGARKYRKTLHALEFVRAISLPECRANSPSFDKLCRDLEALFPPPPAGGGGE
jgi:hypothetical protein